MHSEHCLQAPEAAYDSVPVVHAHNRYAYGQEGPADSDAYKLKP